VPCARFFNTKESLFNYDRYRAHIASPEKQDPLTFLIYKLVLFKREFVLIEFGLAYK